MSFSHSGLKVSKQVQHRQSGMVHRLKKVFSLFLLSEKCISLRGLDIFTYSLSHGDRLQLFVVSGSRRFQKFAGFSFGGFRMLWHLSWGGAKRFDCRSVWSVQIVKVTCPHQPAAIKFLLGNGPSGSVKQARNSLIQRHNEEVGWQCFGNGNVLEGDNSINACSWSTLLQWGPSFKSESSIKPEIHQNVL